MRPYYEKNGISIYHGSATETLMSLNNCCDLILCDPPYGINYQNNYTTRIHKRIEGDAKNFSYYEWAKEAYRLLNDNSALFAFTGWSEYPKHCSQIKECGYSLKEPLILQKRPSGTSNLTGCFQTNSDWVIFAHKGNFKFRKTELMKNKKAGAIPNKGRKPVPYYKTRFPSCWFGENFPWSTENPSSISKWRHPTIKNATLLSWIISLSTDKDAVVLDPFMGSGSTLIGAYRVNRRAIGIEIEEGYCEMAANRIEETICSFS